MASSLAWLDHDSAAHERAKRILALFQEKGTQDQLGLGGVRDSFADLFFPGTSTIQTRLRYFLFVPWIYARLERDQVPSSRFGPLAREHELALVDPLLSLDEYGVFGRTAGGDLKRLPSDVYWGGLKSWGIRQFDLSRAQYHRSVDELYLQRRLSKRSHREDEDRAGPVTWHQELPPPPPSFPDGVTLDLSRDEAEFLRDRIVAEHSESLLAWLVLHPVEADVAFPWKHPLLDSMPEEHRVDLHHARLFSEAMAGAPILYNRMVAEELGNEGLVDEYRQMHTEWAAGLDLTALATWSLNDFFRRAERQRTHTITPQTEEFVRRWVDAVLMDVQGLPERESVRLQIRRREISLKGAHSLFTNHRARAERYRGGLGIGRLTYRWPDVQVLLTDLYAGFGQA